MQQASIILCCGGINWCWYRGLNLLQNGLYEQVFHDRWRRNDPSIPTSNGLFEERRLILPSREDIDHAVKYENVGDFPRYSSFINDVCRFQHAASKIGIDVPSDVSLIIMAAKWGSKTFIYLPVINANR